MRIFGGWFSTSRVEAPPSDEPESAAPPGAPARPAAAAVMPVLDDGAPPESERTVYKLVPADLLQRARQAALSDLPPPSFDDGDRTAVFSPPRELLTQSLRFQGSASDSHDRTTPVADPPRFPSESGSPPSSEAPEISVEAAPELVATAPAHRSEAPALEAEAPNRRWGFGVVAGLVVLLLLAASLFYMHSGRSLLMPSSPTKNG